MALNFLKIRQMEKDVIFLHNILFVINTIIKNNIMQVINSLRIYHLCFICLILSSCQNQNEELTLSSQEVAITKEEIGLDRFHIYNRLDSVLQELAMEQALDWMLIKAIIIKESHFDSQFISTAGAVGLMQLMPRKGSFISPNYKAYQQARKQKRAANGVRYYRGKSIHNWANAYIRELDSLKNRYQTQLSQLYQADQRFNPTANIREGIRQFSTDFRYFRRQGKGKYTSRLLSLAAYNAGRGAVLKANGIPINRQTELYVAYVERIYLALKNRNGKLDEWNEWILKI